MLILSPFLICLVGYVCIISYFSYIVNRNFEYFQIFITFYLFISIWLIILVYSVQVILSYQYMDNKIQKDVKKIQIITFYPVQWGAQPRPVRQCRTHWKQSSKARIQMTAKGRERKCHIAPNIPSHPFPTDIFTISPLTVRYELPFSRMHTAFCPAIPNILPVFSSIMYISLSLVSAKRMPFK